MIRERLWGDRRFKPSYGSVEINWGHPLARGLYFPFGDAWLLNEGSGYPVSLVLNIPTSAVVAPLTWISGQMGLGLNAQTLFVGSTNQAIDFSTGNFTIDMWFMTTNPGTFEDIVARDVSGSRAWQVGYSLVTTTKMSFFSNVSSASVTGTTSLASGQLYYAAVTRVGSTVTLYLNGVSENTGTITDDFTTGLSNNVTFCGREFAGATQHMTGQLFMFSVRKAVGFTASEVQQAYEDPFCFLRPVKRVRYFTASGSTQFQRRMLGIPKAGTRQPMIFT